ncbi:MAG: serine/threonine protein kinase, partial [Gammaproteobacteria bacterium]|nr:serine/threonine protein kinase [Gammaproteobacteria bacterium]
MATLPKTIGKYSINRLLGEGAMGLVYEGMDLAIDRKVAIKTLHPHLITKRDGKEFLERFQREAKSAARCTHPNIVTILEYGEDDGLPFIAMEFINGLSLYDILQKNKKISLKNTLTIVSQILKAIHAAHKLGVIHRDIKTANIIQCKETKSIKLADFGIARFTENNSMTLT